MAVEKRLSGIEGRSMGKRDNRGMSLVELIIVIALMSIVIGMTGYGLGLINNKSVDECAKKLEMALNRNRTNAMGKKECWIEFYLDNNKVTMYEYMVDASGNVQDSTTVIGADGVKLRLTYKDGSTVELDGTHRRIAFTRDSGSLSDTYGTICTKIEVYKGEYSSTTNIRTIELEELTGKVTMQ